MKKAFYPGMAGLGRLRTTKDRPRRSDQDNWQGVVSFNDYSSGSDSFFPTGESPRTGHYPNVDYGPTPDPDKSSSSQGSEMDE